MTCGFISAKIGSGPLIVTQYQWLNLFLDFLRLPWYCLAELWYFALIVCATYWLINTLFFVYFPQLYVAAVSPARDEKATYVAWGHSTVINPWYACVFVFSFFFSSRTLACYSLSSFLPFTCSFFYFPILPYCIALRFLRGEVVAKADHTDQILYSEIGKLNIIYVCIWQFNHTNHTWNRIPKLIMSIHVSYGHNLF